MKAKLPNAIFITQTFLNGRQMKEKPSYCGNFLFVTQN